MTQIPATTVTLGASGRLVIPANYRKALQLKEGDTLVLRLIDNELRLSTIDEAITFAQDLVASYIPANRSLANELIRERQVEAEHDS